MGYRAFEASVAESVDHSDISPARYPEFELSAVFDAAPGFNSDSPAHVPAFVPRDFIRQDDLPPTPVDPLTHIPYPLVRSKDIPMPNKGEGCNWHHAEHPKNRFDVNDHAAMAVRNARLQWYSEELHRRYHKSLAGPLPLESVTEQLTYVIATMTGYVPEFGIDVSGPEAVVVRLDEFEREWLQQSGELKAASSDSARRFITACVMDQPLSHVDEIKIEEFIDPETDPEQKWFLGNWLLAHAVESAVEKVRPVYAELWQQRAVLPTVPAKTETYVAQKLGRGKRRQALIDILEAKLQQAS